MSRRPWGPSEEAAIAYELERMGGRLITEVWDDLRFPVSGINPPGAASDPSLDTTTGLFDFSASQTNLIAFQFQMPHTWKEGSAIHPHLHWRKKSAGAGNVLWRLQYEIVNVGGLFTGSYTTVDVSTTMADTPDDNSALRHLISTFGETTMTGKLISCMGICLVSRIGGNALDTYGGLATLLEIDIHYLLDSRGSVNQFNKDANPDV